MKYLWKHWASLVRRVNAPKKILFLIDFDGTLSPIARMPSQATVSKRNMESLSRLSRSPDRRVCVVSGRSLKDLTPFFKGLNNIIFVGNHGLEFSRLPQQHFPKRRSFIKERKKLAIIRQKLLSAFMYWPGIFIEDKQYGIAVHYRNIPRTHAEVFHAMIEYFRKNFRYEELEWKKGKRVWEIRTRSMWHKGDAANAVHNQFRTYFPVIIGDDATDEDMFRVMKKRGMTVRVGRRRRSAADYYVRSTREVTKLLEALCP